MQSSRHINACADHSGHCRPRSSGGMHALSPPCHSGRLLIPVDQSQPCRSQHRWVGCRCSMQPAENLSDGTDLATEFSRHVLAGKVKPPLTDRTPTHLLAPTAVVAAQLDALQMNDWPEPDAGVRTAFSFSKPLDCESMLPGQVAHSQARSWAGVEEWLSFKDFSNLLHSPPYSVLVNCDSWQATSPLVFPSTRKGERALQAVSVMAKRRGAAQQQNASELRPYTFTFCLELVGQGPYKGCWMTVGIRVGDYASV